MIQKRDKGYQEDEEERMSVKKADIQGKKSKNKII
jgi:hypothetical protein